MRNFSVPPERDLPAGRLQPRKEHLVNEIVQSAVTSRRRRRRLLLVLIPAAVLALAATGFTAYVVTREPTHLESIGCYDRASLDANVAVVSADGRDPAEICAELWAADASGEGRSREPGELTSCVLDSGAVGVFPGSGAGTCGRLGLADLPASYAAEARQFAALRDALTRRLGFPGSGTELPSGPCVGEEPARAIVEEELRRHGYGGWRIETTEPYSAERPCTMVAFDNEEEIVFLVPDARRPG
jgi:hypothetical protein